MSSGSATAEPELGLFDRVKLAESTPTLGPRGDAGHRLLGYRDWFRDWRWKCTVCGADGSLYGSRFAPLPGRMFKRCPRAGVAGALSLTTDESGALGLCDGETQ